jgi:hypothetical protein
MKNITDIVKSPNVVGFDYFRNGIFYYVVYNPNETPNGVSYRFPVPIEDIQGATMNKTDKAISFMRWIRKAIKEKTIYEVQSG